MSGVIEKWRRTKQEKGVFRKEKYEQETFSREEDNSGLKNAGLDVSAAEFLMNGGKVITEIFKKKKSLIYV